MKSRPHLIIFCVVYLCSSSALTHGAYFKICNKKDQIDWQAAQSNLEITWYDYSYCYSYCYYYGSKGKMINFGTFLITIIITVFTLSGKGNTDSNIKCNKILNSKQTQWKEIQLHWSIHAHYNLSIFLVLILLTLVHLDPYSLKMSILVCVLLKN